MRGVAGNGDAFVQAPGDRDMLVGLAERFDTAARARVILLAMLVAAKVGVDAFPDQRYPFSTVTTAHCREHQWQAAAIARPSSSVPFRVNYMEFTAQFAR